MVRMSEHMWDVNKCLFCVIVMLLTGNTAAEKQYTFFQSDEATFQCEHNLTVAELVQITWKINAQTCAVMEIMYKNIRTATRMYGCGLQHRASITVTNLTIFSLEFYDEGKFSCTALHSDFLIVTGARFNLTIKVRPQGVTITGLGQSVRENTEVEVTCDVSQVKPQADIYWRKGLYGSLETGTIMKQINANRTFKLQSTYKVSFSRSDHNTLLYCLVTRPGDNSDVWGSSSKIVSVLYPPSTTVTQKTSGNPTEGDSVTLTCDITDGRPRDDIKSVTWKKEGQEVTSSGRTSLNGRDLTISSLDHSKDDGSYICAAENAAGMGGSGDAFQLNVLYLPSTRVTQMISGNPTEGGSVTLTCDITDGRPRDDIKRVTWKKGGQEITSSGQINLTGRDLTISSLEHSKDDGSYTCAAENFAGMGVFGEALQLQINYPPSTKVIQKSSGTPTEGRSVTLTCDITGGRPRDVIKRVTWKKDGKEFTFSGQISITGRDLTISSFGHSKDDGSYTCAAENAAGMGGSGDAFQLNVLCPAGKPSDFTILHNHTSVALTLQWRPGFDGGYPPQTFTLQYRASNEGGLKTWSNIFNYTAEDVTWCEATVTGLHPVTQYVFSLYAENSRPRDKGPNRSLTVTQKGSTTASPQVTIASVKLEEDHMTVTWSYNGQSSRRKRSTSTNASVVIYYQPDGGEEAHYPLEGSVAAEERQVTINGQFDDKAKYTVWLKVYEGLLDVSSRQTKPFEAAVEKEPPQPSGSTSGVVIGTYVAAVVGIAIIVSLIVLFVYCHRIKNKDSNNSQAQSRGSGINVEQPAIAMNENFRPVTDDMTNQYQSLTSSADISRNQGTYARLSKPEEPTNLPTPGPTYEEIGTRRLTKHSYY